jgi:hypothetical protein
VPKHFEACFSWSGNPRLRVVHGVNRSEDRAEGPETRPRRGQTGPCRGEKEAKSVSETQPWPTRASAEHVDLMAKSGVLHDQLAARAKAQVGGDQERFDTSRQGLESRPQPAANLEDAGDHRGDFHGHIRPRKLVASRGLSPSSIPWISFWMRDVASKGQAAAKDSWRRFIPDRGSFRVARRPESGRLSSSRNLIGCHKVPSDRAPRTELLATSSSQSTLGPGTGDLIPNISGVQGVNLFI